MRRDTTQGKRLFAEWVRQQNPDILALQEVNDFTQFTLETLAAKYGHDYAVISKDPKLIPGSVGSRTKFPVSISSKSPVVNVDKVLDNMWHGFIKCKVEGYNVIVLHLNPHLYEARRREIRTVLETVKQSGLFEKWIIMGDFNTVSAPRQRGLCRRQIPATEKGAGESAHPQQQPPGRTTRLRCQPGDPRLRVRGRRVGGQGRTTGKTASHAASTLSTSPPTSGTGS